MSFSKIPNRLLVTATLCAGISASSAIAEEVNFGGLLDELANRDTLAVFPDTFYLQEQASSHDTRNAMGYSPLGAPWGLANVDFGNFLRSVEIEGRTELVLMEEQGPGVLNRWWATGLSKKLIDNHRFRIYIDGSATPVIDATGKELIGGNNFGFGDSLNFATPETGGNLYAPIPYAKKIVITWDGPMTHGHPHVALRDQSLKNSIQDALWYNINFRTLPEGTDVKSFSLDDLQHYKTELDRANQFLAELKPTGHVADRFTDSQELADGASASHTIEGPAAIRRLQVRIKGADQVAALKDTHIVLTFDGKQTARIPVGEFFGNGRSESQEKPYNVGADYIRQVAADGSMLSLWVMPFEQSAEVRLENSSGQPIQVEWAIDSGNWTWDDRSMYFHADYVAETDILTRQAPGGPWPGNAGKRELYSSVGDGDFRFIDIRGEGVFVGDTMSIRNKSTGAGMNSWWGEGDEKIYIDYLDSNGDGSTAKPLQLGTGVEDYYGYSFGSGKEFATPFVTQPNAAGNRRDDGSITIQGRVRGLDALAFKQSLKFDMEIWKWRKGIVDYAAATFWYGKPGTFSLRTVGDLSADFGQENRWTYLASSQANPADNADTEAMSPGQVGSRGNDGLGGGENGAANFPAISLGFIEQNAEQNIDLQGKPGYHEIALHPAGGDAQRPYTVARWTADEASAGLVNINGAVRNLVSTGDSIDFTIYVDGKQAFKAAGTNGQLAETYFDFDRTITAGQTIDFVVGNGGNGDFNGDETWLRVIVRAAND